MPCPGVGPCEPWDLNLECCLPSGRTPDPCLNDGTPVSQAIVDQMKLVASQYMWMKTGMQFGECTVTIRPLCWNKCPSPCEGVGDGFPWVGGNDWGYAWTPVHLASGDWTNVSCSEKDNCTCTELCEIELPYPVCSIQDVKIDGVSLGPSQYAVRDFRKLVRVKGGPHLIGPADWAEKSVETPGVSVSYSDPAAGNILIGGNINIGLNPFIGYELPVVTGPGILWTMGGQTIQQPVDLKMCFLFNNTGDTITVDPAAVESVSGPATYDSNTGLITYTGAFPNAANLALFNSQVVCVNYRQGFQASSITTPQPVTIWQVQWTDDQVSGGCWPECNNLTLPDTEPGTWSITLTYGRPVPELVRLAAQEFACELIKGCVGQPCKLPQRMQSISRQGVTVSFLDPMDFLKEGGTGIFLVDLAIKTYNPHGLYKKPSVTSPDSLGQRSVVTWP